jgi:hypothetical protein
MPGREQVLVARRSLLLASRLTIDIDAGRSSVCTASEVGKAPSVDEWRKDREWLFDETGE